jgi:hypothetical protein
LRESHRLRCRKERAVVFSKLAQLSQFEGIFGKIQGIRNRKSFAYNPRFSKVLVVKTYPLDLRKRAWKMGACSCAPLYVRKTVRHIDTSAWLRIVG